MFRFDPSRQYLMPAHFGPPDVERTSPRYLDVTTMSIGYLTDRDKLAQYLPEPFEIRGDPVVSVYYAMNREVEWMAGGGYNLLGVDAIVRFNGEVDQVDGSYCLVLWENDFDPIVGGRELLGAPKIYADIEDHRILAGTWSTTASLRGQTIVELSVGDLQPVPEPALRAMRQASVDAYWMGWRYVPNIGEPGAAVSHATCIPSAGAPREVWSGSGEVRWHRTSWEKNPTQAHIVNALADLPILEYRWAQVARGESTLVSDVKKPLRALR